MKPPYANETPKCHAHGLIPWSPLTLVPLQVQNVPEASGRAEHHSPRLLHLCYRIQDSHRGVLPCALREVRPSIEGIGNSGSRVFNQMNVNHDQESTCDYWSATLRTEQQGTGSDT